MALKRKIRDTRHQFLMMLANQGNEEAFRKLYREIYAPVSAYVQQRVSHSADAEDIVGDVFRNFVAKLDTYDSSKGSVLTWIVTMARNRVIDHHRRAKPLMVDSREMANLLVGERPGVLQRMIQEENLGQIQAILLKQPPEVREMFDLRFGQGLRVWEVAQVMGLGLDAVKQRFSRTMKIIRIELGENQKPAVNRKGGNSWVVTD